MLSESDVARNMRRGATAITSGCVHKRLRMRSIIFCAVVLGYDFPGNVVGCR